MRRRDLEDDDDPIVPDGGVVRTRVTLMDGRPINARDHQPHFATDTTARRATRDAYFEMVRRAENAWRTPARDAAEPDSSSPPEVMRRHLRTEPDDDAQARRDRAYADYCAKVSQAWQQANPTVRANSVERQRKQWTAER